MLSRWSHNHAQQPKQNLPIMTLIGRIDLNVRHYSRRAREAVDTLSIAVLSGRQYERMHVPAWNDEKANAVRNAYSPFSRMLDLNNTSPDDGQRVIDGGFRLFDREIRGEDAFPDWHKDYLSGQRYPVRPYTRYRITPDTGSDIIAPWELSRLQFIPSLIRAYRLTNDDRYAKHFFDVIAHWKAANPFLFGVNWMCGLDVAIRAFNLALGIIYFNQADQCDRSSALRLLWAHLIYLQKRDLYLRKETVNNHQLVAALLHYALLHLFPVGETSGWRTAAFEIVRAEIERQFRSDGGNFESALLYHQFVLEAMFATLGLLADPDVSSTIADKSVLPEVFGQRLRTATRFVADYYHAWSEVPQLGDSSDGRIVFFGDYFSWKPDNAAYLADWSALVFPERDCFRDTATTGARTVIRRESGLGMFSCNRYAAMFSAMPVTPRAAGHNHLDKASLLLRVPESPILVDSGTFCYTSDLATRACHRAGRAHNVLLVDDEEQALLGGAGAFETPQFADVGIELLSEGPDQPAFRMWHDGYCRLPGLGRVTRQVHCLPEGLRLHDALAGDGRVQVQLISNLHPQLSTKETEHGIRIALDGRLLCTIKPEPGWMIAFEPAWHSPSYGRRQASVRLVLSAKVALPLEAVTVISLPLRT